MNIFYLDHNTKLCAQYHHDKHVVKMVLESAQLLSAAHRVLDGELYFEIGKRGQKIKRWRLYDPNMEHSLYKATHVNHPSNVWTRSSDLNYMWLYDLFTELSNEYEHRYGRVHASWSLLGEKLKNPPKNIRKTVMTQIPQAMPDIYKCNDPVQAYRNYYIGSKKYQSKYTNRSIPQWMS